MSIEDLPGGLKAEIDLDLAPSARKEEAKGESSGASTGPPDFGPCHGATLSNCGRSTVSVSVW